MNRDQNINIGLDQPTEDMTFSQSSTLNLSEKEEKKGDESSESIALQEIINELHQLCLTTRDINLMRQYRYRIAELDHELNSMKQTKTKIKTVDDSVDNTVSSTAHTSLPLKLTINENSYSKLSSFSPSSLMVSSSSMSRDIPLNTKSVNTFGSSSSKEEVDAAHDLLTKQSKMVMSMQVALKSITVKLRSTSYTDVIEYMIQMKHNLRVKHLLFTLDDKENPSSVFRAIDMDTHTCERVYIPY